MIPLPRRAGPRAWLAAAALLLAAGALLAGEPYRGSHARVDVAELARAVEREEDHVDALELARWIRRGEPGLRVVDVRPPGEFAAYHLPGAESVPLGGLQRAGFRPDETVVLYSEGGAHAAQAWVLLRAMGIRRVFFLRGGLREWLDEVMEPRVAEDASPARRAAFRETAELSRYFGGTPRVVAPGEADAPRDAAVPGPSPDGGPPASTADAVRRLHRSGC